jgi:hypothetical protein
MFGFHGRIITIDLSHQNIAIETLAEDICA